MKGWKATATIAAATAESAALLVVPIAAERLFAQAGGNLVGVDTARVMRLTQEARDAVMRRGNFQLNLVG